MLEAINATHQKHSDETVERINNHLFETIYKRYIPESVFEEVREGLLGADFFRKNWKTKIIIRIHQESQKNWSGNNTFVSLSVSHSYTMQNISKSSSKEFKINVLIDLPQDERLKKLCCINSIYIDNELVSDRIDLEKLDYSKPFLEWGMPTHLIPANESVDICVTYTQVQHVYGAEVLCSYSPSESMELEVITPQEDLNIEVVSLHPKDAVLACPTGLTTRMWKLPYGVFPGQGLYCQWRPINDVGVDSGEEICQASNVADAN